MQVVMSNGLDQSAAILDHARVSHVEMQAIVRTFPDIVSQDGPALLVDGVLYCWNGEAWIPQ